MDRLQELFVHELKDLYNAEQQLVKTLPKLAKKAVTPQLKDAFEEHLEQTKEHVNRLEKIFDNLGKNPRGMTCAGMKGLIKEGNEMASEFEETARDAALIAAAQRVEHYEIAGYGTACSHAKLLGESEAQELLHETLEEEKATDQKLTDLAEGAINQEAAEGMEATEMSRRKTKIEESEEDIVEEP